MDNRATTGYYRAATATVSAEKLVEVLDKSESMYKDTEKVRTQTF